MNNDEFIRTVVADYGLKFSTAKKICKDCKTFEEIQLAMEGYHNLMSAIRRS